MNRYRVGIVLMVAACLAAAGICVLVLAVPEPGVTKYNYDRVHTGMSFAEVEALLGKPPDETSEGGESAKKDDPAPEMNYVWRGWKCRVLITVGKNGVTAKGWQND